MMNLDSNNSRPTEAESGKAPAGADHGLAARISPASGRLRLA
jgi:hypothetical protein